MTGGLHRTSVCIGLCLGVAGALAVGAQRTGGPRNAADGAGAAAQPPPPFTSYDVVADADEERFEAAVRAKVREGWEPVGGVEFAPREGPGEVGRFMQAMGTRQQ